MRIIGSIILLAALALTGDAQTCNVRARAYVAPTYQAYHAPTYNQYAYRAVSVDYYYPPLLALDVFPRTNYLISYAQAGNSELELKLTLANIQLEQEKIKYKVLQLQQGGQQPLANPPKMNQPDPVPEQGQVSVVGARLALLKPECAMCHDGAGAKGGISLTLNNGTALAPLTVAQEKALVWVLYTGTSKSSGKPMPPSGKKLNDKQVIPALLDSSPEK